jgi:hypothetical protein
MTKKMTMMLIRRLKISINGTKSLNNGKHHRENFLAGYSLDELFPDQLFPADSEQSKLTGTVM